MRCRIIIFAVIFSIIPFFYVCASEYEIESDVGVTGILLNFHGNKAKFNEYRDIEDGVYGRFHFKYDSNYFLDFKASDIAYDTQYYRLEGGKWGSFKYHLEYKEIPHNFTFGAKSFYSGIGSNNLTFSAFPPNTDIRTWSTFDYSVERKSYGGGIKLDMLRPLFFDISISREEKDGVYPAGVAGTSPGGIAVELPEPINYTTDTLKFEVGYAKRPLFLSLSFFLSEFENDNHNLNFRNPATANTASTTDVLTLSPDNKYYKIAFKGNVKVPLNSKLSVNLASSRTKSEADLLDFFVDDVPGGRIPITISDKIFDGKIDTQSYDLVLTSNPFPFLDGKVFYKYYKRENKSDEIRTIEDDEILTNELFGYRKNYYGIEIGLRFPARLYLITAYSHVKKERKREDVPENKDDIYSFDLKWTGLDFMNIKVGYEKMHRTAEFHAPEVGPEEPDFIETFVGRFDVAAKERDTYRASVEVSPIESLNFGFGYKNKNTDYKDVILGLRESKSDEFNIDADVTLGKIMKVAVYYDYEKIKHSQFQRQLPFNATTGFDPGTPPTPSSFNWGAKERDKNYNYGIGADIYVIQKKFTVRLQHDYIRSDGAVDYTYFLGTNPLPPGRTQDNIDISNWDDYRLRIYLIKAVYNATKKLLLSAGFIHERFSYSDAQLDGYEFVPATAGTNGAFLTGAYRDQSYRANIIFLGLACRF
ncbi:MAG: MtrB/PioB family outer membrane beta-barrel protein [Nitrospirota bacterium]